MTPELHAKINFQYPQFEYLLHLVHGAERGHWHPLRKWSPSSCSTWGEADSSFRDFQDYLIEYLSRDTDFPEALATLYESKPEIAMDVSYDDDVSEATDVKLWIVNHYGYSCYNWPVGLRSGHPMSKIEPWSIPSDHELSQFNIPVRFRDQNDFWQRVKWRFSAAAAAIHFLKSVPDGIILGMKKMVFHENRQSVTKAECHVLGLIPLCQQNPHLHVERRINMWRTLTTAKLTI